MYLSLIINCLTALLFANPATIPNQALIFYGDCRPAPIVRLPEAAAKPIITKKPDAPVFDVVASSAAVMLLKYNTFLYEKNVTSTQPIASLTKMMTALVFLDHNPGWDTKYIYTVKDNIAGGLNNLFLGDELSIRDLFNTSLIASDNGATLALAHSTGLSDQDFVKAMNDKAKSLGLFNTSFVEPTGLSDNDLSDAQDVARLAAVALNNFDIIKTVSQKSYHFKTTQGRDKNIISTDYLLSEPVPAGLTIMGGKTGFTDNAGYCFVGRFQTAQGDQLISVVLNSSGKEDRFTQTRRLISWVFTNFTWL